MPDAPRDEHQEKGDEVLRRLLKTPPEPKPGKSKPEKDDADELHPKRD